MTVVEQDRAAGTQNRCSEPKHLLAETETTAPTSLPAEALGSKDDSWIPNSVSEDPKVHMVTWRHRGCWQSPDHLAPLVVRCLHGHTASLWVIVPVRAGQHPHRSMKYL